MKRLAIQLNGSQRIFEWSRSANGCHILLLRTLEGKEVRSEFTIF